MNVEARIAGVLENLATLRDDMLDEMPTGAAWIDAAIDELRRARFHERENYHRWKCAEAVTEKLGVEEWHPDDGDSRCQRCGMPNVVWFAPNDLWNAVSPYLSEGILCPPCFIGQAEALIDQLPAWRIEPAGSPDKQRAEAWDAGHRDCVCARPGATPCRNPYREP